MSGAVGLYISEDFGGNSVERARKLLVGIPNGVTKAVRSALPRAASALKTESTKAIRERYDISAANIRAGENITVKIHDTEAQVKFSGKKIPLYRYNGTTPKFPTTDNSKTIRTIVAGQLRPVHPSVAASAHQLKGTSVKRFENAFVAKMKSGHIGIFERTGGITSSGSNEIKELQGSSVAQMLGSKEVQDELVNKASQKFEERMEHEIMRIMNGWSGT